MGRAIEPLRILVVDDEATQRELVGGFLTKQGHQVTPAQSGEDALASVRLAQFDLILSDCKMPGISGPELLREVKAINPDVKVLAMSGYTKYVAPKNEIGEISGFLQKPFESYYLLSVVRRILDARPHDFIRN